MDGGMSKRVWVLVVEADSNPFPRDMPTPAPHVVAVARDAESAPGVVAECVKALARSHA